MTRHAQSLPKQRRLKMAHTLCVLLLAVTLAGCGGSMGSDPSSPSGASPSVPPPITTSNPIPPPPSAPTAANGSLANVMGTATAGTLSGKGTAALSYAISVPPQGGTATLSNPTTGAFTYTSYPNFTGRDSFQFTVTDSAGTSQPATETLTVTSPALGAEHTVANIGVSIDWLCYWCTAQPYVNIVRQAAEFGDPSTGTPLIEEGKLDQNGWPEADTRIMIACCTKQDMGSRDDPGPESPLIGKYQLSFNGMAVIWDDGGKVEDQHYDPATNTTSATLDQTPLNKNGTGFDMLLSFSKTQRTAGSAVGSGFTNLRIIRPQFAPNGMKWWDTPTQEFTDPFLNSLKGFSTIRYIDWTKVIGSPEVNWADRTPGHWPVAAHEIAAAPGSLPYLSGGSSCTGTCWYGTGGSWESAIEIANATHTDMWINIPVMASDDYVKSLAALLKSKLDPDLHVYVEWSDEIWNYGNPFWTETNYNMDQMKALLASNPTAAANYTNNCVSWANAECHVAERVLQFGQDFASVYGQSAIPTTVRPVLCTQVVQPVFMQLALRFVALTYGPPAKYFYGICGAPYWGVSSTLPSSTTVAGAVAALDQAIPNNDGYLLADTATALYYDLHNLTYEGGPDNTSFAVAADTSGQAAKALETAVQTAPGMQADVNQGLTRAFADGIDMYMYYENESATYWGASVDPLDLEAPKFMGLTETVGRLVTRNAGTTLPGILPAGQPSFFVAGAKVVPSYMATGIYCEPAKGTNPAYCAWNGSTAQGTGLGFLINVPKDGNYTFSVVMDDSGGNRSGSFNFKVDQKTVTTLSVPATAAGTPLTLSPTSVSLSAGLHLVELVDAVGKGSYAVDSIKVTAN